SGYDFGQLPAAGVERVEVVRGPFSALYGSEAVSGVVNVLTTPSATSGSADAEAGERGLFNLSASGALTRDSWSVHAAGEHRADDGFEENDDFTSRTFLGGATAGVTDAFSIGFLGRHTSYDLGVPRAPNADSTAFVPSPLRRQDGSEAQFVVPLRYDRGSTVYELRLSESRRSEHFADVAGPFGPEASDTDTLIRAARSTARFGSFTVGGEYELAVVDHVSNFSLIDERERANRSAFVENRSSFANGIELVAGVRFDDFETFGSELSPRVGVAWIAVGGKLRAAYGEGFRAPAIGELYSPFFGNDALEAERSSTVEVGYDRFGVNGSASLTIFRSDYEQLIVFGDDFRFQNIAAADAQGLELSASRRAGAFTGSFSYTWLDTEDTATGETLVRRPEHSGSVAFGYRATAFAAHFVVLHTGARADVTDLLPFGRVTNDAYTTADLVFSYDVNAFAPYVKIENLTNQRYEEVFGYPSASRRIRVGVRYRLR
ncbi:MAG TPA: TonB-dependent receptor, partial [Thermoanaerobaculia bacterium]